MTEPSIKYGQVWEDADVLAEGLGIQPGDRVLSISSAGDNALALLIEDPAEVVAVDLNPAQLACLALRVAAFRTLSHGEMLELIGSRPSLRRGALYQRARPALDADARAFWDARPDAIQQGIGNAGSFERYFALFRRAVRLVHRRRTLEALLAGATLDPAHLDDLTEVGDPDVAARRSWYDRHWDTVGWRALFRVMASRAVLGRARYPTAFAQVEGGVAGRILDRVRTAVTATDPAANPYLQWVLAGTHRTALPRYLRPEHFDAIRDRLDRLSVRLGPLDAVLAKDSDPFHRYNLSDVFEYLAPADADALYRAVADASPPGARVVTWSVLADRLPGPSLDGRLVRLEALSDALHARDKAPFYQSMHVHEVR